MENTMENECSAMKSMPRDDYKVCAQYLVFRGSDYYPSGGCNDLVGSAESLREAVYIAVSGTDSEGRSAYSHCFDWFNVLDVFTGKMVMLGKFRYGLAPVESDVDLGVETDVYREKELSVQVLTKVICKRV